MDIVAPIVVLGVALGVGFLADPVGYQALRVATKSTATAGAPPSPAALAAPSNAGGASNADAAVAPQRKPFQPTKLA